MFFLSVLNGGGWEGSLSTSVTTRELPLDKYISILS